MNLEAVIFDLDGTLLDTLGDMCDACNYAMAKYHHPEISLAQAKSYIGHGIKNLVLRCLNNEEEDLDKCYAAFKKYYKENCDNHTYPYEGIFEVLDYLKEKNIKMACFSNKAQYALDTLIVNHFKDYFQVVVGDGAGYQRKPDPEGLYAICTRMGVRADNIMYIGDSEVDQELISHAGCLGAIVSYGFRSEEDLKKSGIKETLKSPKELLEYLKSYFGDK